MQVYSLQYVCKVDKATNTKEDMKMQNVVEMVIEAYIRVMGAEKWYSLTAEQQHDIIMTIVKDASKALENI